MGRKQDQRRLWHAIDPHAGAVLAYVFGRRQDEVFLKLKALLEPFGITQYEITGLPPKGGSLPLKLDSPIEGSSSWSIIVTPSGIEPSEVNSLPLPAKAGSPTEVALWGGSLVMVSCRMPHNAAHASNAKLRMNLSFTAGEREHLQLLAVSWGYLLGPFG